VESGSRSCRASRHVSGVNGAGLPHPADTSDRRLPTRYRARRDRPLGRSTVIRALGQSVVIENRVGVSSNIATRLVVRAPPDEHTLIELTSVNSWNVALYDKLKFDLMRDVAPIASIYRGIGVVVVQPSFPAKTLGELVAYAKENPGKIRMGWGGVGTP
jgi:tripartite-type tricarboxylate transporter receptor subunit TctC